MSRFIKQIVFPLSLAPTSGQREYYLLDESRHAVDDDTRWEVRQLKYYLYKRLYRIILCKRAYHNSYACWLPLALAASGSGSGKFTSERMNLANQDEKSQLAAASGFVAERDRQQLTEYYAVFHKNNTPTRSNNSYIFLLSLSVQLGIAYD